VTVNPNPDQIVHDIRAYFESILTNMTGTAAQTMTADAIERSLWRHMLELGRQLLYLFLVWRAHTSPQQFCHTPAGESLPLHAQRRRSYRSIFGAISFWRPYFYRKGHGGALPLDDALHLPHTSWSDLLREQVEALVVSLPYRKAADILQRFVQLKLSTHTIADLVAEDARLVASFYDGQPPAKDPPAATLLVAQADGKGVPMRRAAGSKKVRRSKGDKAQGKKEAVVTSLYTIAPRIRTPQQVVASLFQRQQPPAQSGPLDQRTRVRPQHKQVWVTLSGKDAALKHLAEQINKRAGPQIQHHVALTDGSEPLQQRMLRYCPTCTLVLDLIHALEYLWKAANALLGETHAQRSSWVAERTLRLLSGQASAVISELEQIAQAPGCKAGQRRVLEQVAGYLQRNLPYMHYDCYLALGWPIATGVVEGACRHVVKDRCELSGMRWSQAGAQALLQLRCVYENGDWEAFHAFRRRQRAQQRPPTCAEARAPADGRILAFPSQPVPALAA
jgi:hypothetical protein